VYVSDIKDDGTVHTATQTRKIEVTYKGKVRTIEVAVIDDRGHELDARVAPDYLAMVAHAARDGHRIRSNTARRDQDHQRRLRAAWERYDKFLADVRAWADGGKVGESPEVVPFAAHAAPVGHSTHEIACSVDIERMEGDDPKTPEPDSPLDLWLAKWAPHYGFVRDVPSEPWHFTHRLAYA
jgi:hypothetical protein